MFGSIGFPEVLVVLLLTLTWVALVIVPAVLICRRLGFAPVLGVLAVIPVANIVLLWFIALSSWPAVPPPAATTTS